MERAPARISREALLEASGGNLHRAFEILIDQGMSFEEAIDTVQAQGWASPQTLDAARRYLEQRARELDPASVPLTTTPAAPPSSDAGSGGDGQLKMSRAHSFDHVTPDVWKKLSSKEVALLKNTAQLTETLRFLQEFEVMIRRIAQLAEPEYAEATQPRFSPRGLEAERAEVERFVANTWPAATETGILQAIRALWGGERDTALQCCSEPSARLVVRVMLAMVYAMDAQMPRHGAHTILDLRAAVRRLHVTVPTQEAYQQALTHLSSLVGCVQALEQKYRDRLSASGGEHAQATPEAKYYVPETDPNYGTALRALAALGPTGLQCLDALGLRAAPDSRDFIVSRFPTGLENVLAYTSALITHARLGPDSFDALPFAARCSAAPAPPLPAASDGANLIDVYQPDGATKGIYPGGLLVIRWRQLGRTRDRPVQITLVQGDASGSAAGPGGRQAPRLVATVVHPMQHAREYVWEVPRDVPPGSHYKIQVQEDAAEGGGSPACDQSLSFTIAPAASVAAGTVSLPGFPTAADSGEDRQQYARLLKERIVQLPCCKHDTGQPVRVALRPHAPYAANFSGRRPVAGMTGTLLGWTRFAPEARVWWAAPDGSEFEYPVEWQDMEVVPAPNSTAAAAAAAATNATATSTAAAAPSAGAPAGHTPTSRSKPAPVGASPQNVSPHGAAVPQPNRVGEAKHAAASLLGSLSGPAPKIPPTPSTQPPPTLNTQPPPTLNTQLPPTPSMQPPPTPRTQPPPTLNTRPPPTSSTQPPPPAGPAATSTMPANPSAAHHASLPAQQPLVSAAAGAPLIPPLQPDVPLGAAAAREALVPPVPTAPPGLGRAPAGSSATPAPLAPTPHSPADPAAAPQHEPATPPASAQVPVQAKSLGESSPSGPVGTVAASVGGSNTGKSKKSKKAKESSRHRGTADEEINAPTTPSHHSHPAPPSTVDALHSSMPYYGQPPYAAPWSWPYLHQQYAAMAHHAPAGYVQPHPMFAHPQPFVPVGPPQHQPPVGSLQQHWPAPPPAPPSDAAHGRLATAAPHATQAHGGPVQFSSPASQGTPTTQQQQQQQQQQQPPSNPPVGSQQQERSIEDPNQTAPGQQPLPSLNSASTQESLVTLSSGLATHSFCSLDSFKGGDLVECEVLQGPGQEPRIALMPTLTPAPTPAPTPATTPGQPLPLSLSTPSAVAAALDSGRASLPSSSASLPSFSSAEQHEGHQQQVSRHTSKVSGPEDEDFDLEVFLVLTTSTNSQESSHSLLVPRDATLATIRAEAVELLHSECATPNGHFCFLRSFTRHAAASPLPTPGGSALGRESKLSSPLSTSLSHSSSAQTPLYAEVLHQVESKFLARRLPRSKADGPVVAHMRLCPPHCRLPVD